ncbi:MAG TPA: carboxypeptidase regulatory-like domain-containing protein [Pedobacter sp.]|uniref:TonB-dependent receptor n=1 Tax=Pedobacter sp. TaxID=1411316 RepID=UPI002BFA52A9|nr:carboxypeptidase regulatory-like domain-containing protein [Pedobacter sp.]HMI01077.1 carboxypeptidase regulatory-like domain-containing protein [Pedobacter sp.]
MLFKHWLFFLLYVLLQTLSAAGQSTKTSLSGRVMNENETAISGAYLTLTHLPTGTVYGCASNLSGAYSFPDLKPGGPYQIETNILGLKKYQVSGIFLKLDEPSVMNIRLQSSINELPEIKIIAAKSAKLLQPNKSGPNFNIHHQDISLLPTVKRSIADFVKLSPQAFGPAIAGGNYRQNFITIDGSEFNNNFGVGDNLPGNGAQPIALDAIAEISVNVAPYHSIWESGFIGSAVNIVSRSGNNQTEGSVYSYFRNSLSYHLEGLRIGGPVVKNKLFYFFSFEQETEKYQPQLFQAATEEMPYGSSPNVARPSDAELNTIRKYLLDTYNYETGPYQGYDFKNKSNKVLLRLDWNIAKNSTLSIRYNQLHSYKPELVNGSRSPLVPYSSSLGRRTVNALPFSNSNFNTLSDFYSLSAEWNSRPSSKITNTMRGSYTRQYEPRTSESRFFPFVDILKDGSPFTSFGYEPFTYGNSRDVYVLSLTDHVSWTYGRGTWVAGVQTDYSNTKNSYMPFGTGYYTYASLEDFTSGKNPLDYAVTYTPDNRKSPPQYSFDYLNISAFLQYSIALSDRLNLTAGLRTDLPVFLKALPENQLLAMMNFAGGQRIHTSLLPKPALLYAPRMAFNYDLTDSKSVKIRGGTGIFTGRIPFVWIISQARYSGVSQLTQTWQGQQNTPGAFNLDYQQQYAPQQGNALPSVTSVLSRDFKMPQSWKSSVGLDMNLPFGFRGSVEAIYNSDINGILFRDANLVEPLALNIPGYPDHRMVYPASNNLKFINPLNVWGQYDKKGNSALNVVEITNSSRGYYFSAIAQIEKRVGKGFNFSLAYSCSMARNYNDGDGDQTLSALNATPSVSGINRPMLSYAGYVPPDRVVSALTWSRQYARHLKFNIGLVYQSANDGRFSYTYSRDFIGDGTNRSLIYVPKDPSEIKFVPLTLTTGNQTTTYSSEQQSTAFFSYIDQDKYLSKRKGKYAERNGALLPWRQQVDLRLSHDVLTGIKGKKHTIQFSCDVLNLGNLINHNWGLKKLVNTSAILVPANLDQIKPEGNILPAFQMATTGGKLANETFRSDYSTNSTYLIQFGIRYQFE